MKRPVGQFLISFSVSFLTIQFHTSPVNCQHFDDNVNDQVYLNQTHDNLKQEVIQTRHELSLQAELVRAATRAYIGAKIKDNLFRELRTLAEKELEALSMQNRPRQPRQDEDPDEEESTTEPGFIPQIATIVKAVFGNNINVTKYVESASKLLPRPIGAQLIGLASLLDTNKFTTTTAPKIVPVAVTPSPVNVTVIHVLGNQQFPGGANQPGQPGQSQYVQVPVNPSLPGSTTNISPGTVVNVVTQKTPSAPTVTAATTTTKAPGDDDDDDNVVQGDIDEVEAESRRMKRQLITGINPMKILDGVESIWKNFNPPATEGSLDNPAYVKEALSSTTESQDGFDDEYTTRPSRVQTAVKGVVDQAQALRKGVPDLFQGAREAYKFLETLNLFLDKWDNQLQAASKDDDDK